MFIAQTKHTCFETPEIILTIIFYTDGQVQVLVTDSTCKSVTLRTARSLCVPVVSTEWVIQCLVNGHLMDFTGHPRYKYDFAVV